MSQPFLTAAELPPRPASATGEPRPPRAPGFHKEEKPAKELDRDRRLSKKPTPPTGQGPVLEWYKSSRRAALIASLIGFVIVVVLLTLVQGGDIAWMSIWYVWLIVLLSAVGVYTSSRSVECSAGAEWLQQGKTWVRLYELTEVKARARSNAIHLDLTDSDGRWVKINSSDIQEDRDMWDLVYNGILHSVIAGGATTNGMLHSALKIPRPAPTE